MTAHASLEFLDLLNWIPENEWIKLVSMTVFLSLSLSFQIKRWLAVRCNTAFILQIKSSQHFNAFQQSFQRGVFSVWCLGLSPICISPKEEIWCRLMAVPTYKWESEVNIYLFIYIFFFFVILTTQFIIQNRLMSFKHLFTTFLKQHSKRILDVQLRTHKSSKLSIYYYYCY